MPAKSEVCKRGHLRTPENVASNGTCRECSRVWNRSNPEKHRAGSRVWGTANPERRAYANAKRRCENPKSNQWKNYGARGIKFLFVSFERFFAEVGRRPSLVHSLDRIENDSHYMPGNVRWATRKEQRANQRRMKKAA